jgi:hypothetical protein
MSSVRLTTRQTSVLLALLAAAAVGLGILAWSEGGLRAPYTGLGDVPASTREAVDTAVNGLLARHGVAPGMVRTWHVSSPDKQEFRIEQRVRVSPDFVSIEFNHELGDMLAPHDIRVSATERTREHTVTMHLVLRGAVIRTITFVMDPEVSR